MPDITHIKLPCTLTFENFAEVLSLTDNGDCGRHSWLIDARGQDINITYQEASILALNIRARPRYKGHGQVAILVDSDASYGRARVLSVVAERIGIELSVHRERESAFAQLA